MLKLYGDDLIKVKFGPGPLGFRIGETDSGNVIVSGFSQNGDSYYPIYNAACIDIGYFIVSVNGTNVTTMDKSEVKRVLKESKPPTIVVFGKPQRNSGSILAKIGLVSDDFWHTKDDFLPMREYDLTTKEMSSTLVDHHGLTLEEKAMTPLYRGGDIFLCDIREYVYNGLPNAKIRASLWKVLLNAHSLKPSLWEEETAKNVSMYSDFVHEFVISRNSQCGLRDSWDVPNPLDVTWKQNNPCESQESLVTNESQWSRDFGDNELRDIIWKDCQRTYSEIPFFVINQAAMARILYIFGKLNQSVEYVQGMNELLAPIVYAFAQAEDPSMEHPISLSVESDSFFAFNILMSETRDLFIRQMDSTSTGLEGVLLRFEEYLDMLAPRSFARLKELGIETQFFAVRWMTTLFAREFPITETLRVWDSILADPKRFQFVYCIGTSLIQHVENQLYEADFAQSVQLLQNYPMPPTEDVLNWAAQVRWHHLQHVPSTDDSISSHIVKAGSSIAEGVEKGVSYVWDHGLPLLSRISRLTLSAFSSSQDNDNSIHSSVCNKQQELIFLLWIVIVIKRCHKLLLISGC